MNRMYVNFAGAALCSAVLLVAGCGEQKAESVWRDREVVIDGVDAEGEWDGARYFLDEEKIAFGVMNDDDFLYLRISSLDRTVRSKVLAGGLIVWFDGSGKCKKRFGVLYPAGVSAARRPGGTTGSPDGTGDQRPDAPGGAGNESAVDERERAEALLGMIGSDIWLIDEDENKTNLTLDEAAENGITCAVGMNGGSLIYELALPLVRDEYRPYGVWPEATKKVGLIFATGKTSSPQRSGGRGEGMPGGSGGTGGRGGGMGGRGGGMGGRGGGMGGSGGMSGGPAGMQSTSEPLQLKLKITLAAQPSVP